METSTVTSTTAPTPTTFYTTTSTARTTTVSVRSTTPSRRTTTEDPLQECQVAGLPSSKEKGMREIEELIKYFTKN